METELGIIKIPSMSYLDSQDLFTIFNVTPDPNELENKTKPYKKEGKISVVKLFRYSDWIDIILIIIGLLGSIGNGATQPLLMLFFGNIINEYRYNGDGLDFPDEERNHRIFETVNESVSKVVLQITYCGVASMGLSFLRTFCFFIVSQKQGIKVRTLYFRALLRQDPSWYDFQESGELSSRIATDIKNFQDGIGPQFGLIFQILSMSLTGYILGFIKCWDLALVMIATIPFSCFSLSLSQFLAMRFSSKALTAFGEGGAIAEETIGNVRTIQSLSQEECFCESYDEKIKRNDKFNALKGHSVGIGYGVVSFFIMASYALASWYGSLVIRGKGGKEGVMAGDVVTVFMAVLTSSQSLSQIVIPLNLLFSSKTSSFKIFATIDRIPDIDTKSTAGSSPNECNGNITLEDVQFRYPTRPTKQILNGLDLEIKKGETVALVGSSGCGKSTTIQLIQRLYDPVGGAVKLDGTDLRELNLKWLRNQIGLVGQEPVLFACTIRQNIMLGARDGETPSEEEMIECAKMANAHEFITHLPEGYDTLIGEKGASLSGGQKQRIAIARALIRRPAILLLDEATSALDTQSEKIVQQALEKAAKGRTTVIVAHRLTTVKNANRICVFHQGEIIEQGTHQELMDLKGTYYGLVKRQSMEEEVDQETVDADLKKFREEENQMRDTIIVDSKSHEGSDELDEVETIQKEYKDEKKKLKHSNRFVLFRVIWNQFKTNWLTFMLGVFGGFFAGAVFPYYTIKFIDLDIMLMELKDGSSLTYEQNYILVTTIGWIVGIGVIAFFAYYFYIGLLIDSGEHMIGSVRMRMYKSILKQDISWFDQKENRTGSLVTRLSSEPTKLSGISGITIGNAICIFSTIGFGFGFALYYNWLLSLCVIAVFPIQTLILCLDLKLNSMESSPAEKAYEQSGITLVEAVESMKTIQSLTQEHYFLEKYSNDLRKPYYAIFKWAPFLSFAHSITNFMNFGVDAYGFYLGTFLIGKKINYNQPTPSFFTDFMDGFMKLQKSVMSIVYTAQGVGFFVEFIPNLGRGLQAAKSCFDVIDRKPKIDGSNQSGNRIDSLKGEIEFKDISFRYPTRPENEVLKGISFKAEQGKTIALVGASGCGKSTTIQLLERFYDPTHGEVLLDGQDIRDLNIHFLRSHIGMVGQEPVLFNESIMDNIKRGIPKGMEVSNEKIYEVCKMANAHDFISSMAEGYNTLVGDGGSQMSGGQKQRIAIARALIRNPKVLLLDEATSALDSESEKVVQDALDKAAKGRTTIVIAHRLSTIQNADQICVITRGKVTEKGTHQELMDLKGFYYTLAMQQFGTIN